MSADDPAASSVRRESFSISVVSRSEFSGCAPWIDGSAAESLRAGVTLGGRFPNGATFTIEVVEMTADSATIKTSNQASWRMMKVSPKQLQSLPSSAGAPASYWVINEQATT